MFATDDTIVAIATPMGRGGIGVIRLSGPKSAEIAGALIGHRAALAPRHATFARIVDPEGERARALDQVVVTWFEAPQSYTGEDVVELSGHGSPMLLGRIVELARQHGARLAEPGEFTLRAYLNGRLDLIQAEAVADLVDAVTPRQARAAMDQLEGTLTKAIRRLDAMLFDLSARLEASLDFPDEGFHFVTREDAARELDDLSAHFGDLLRSGRTGRVLREGRLVVIAGPPNAGKSSLFNALAGADRAIVTDVPGTTRDVLTEQVDIGGVPITLVDTAGLRESTDPIEAEGVDRARQAQRVASLTLVVLDRSRPLGEAEHAVLREAAAPRLIVASKSDLTARWSPDGLGPERHNVIDVSALNGEGLGALREQVIASLLDREDLRDVPAISNLRHLALVEEAHAAIVRASGVLTDGGTEELVLAELTLARQRLEELTGTRTPDDLLHHIFSRFCVGK
jgi:tRNA modification GTPase